jgi:hypothetical protein
MVKAGYKYPGSGAGNIRPVHAVSKGLSGRTKAIHVFFIEIRRSVSK